MAETKPKQSSSLREPKPKKTLGLRPPTMLHLPHDDLIKPEHLPLNITDSATAASTPVSTPVTTPVDTPATDLPTSSADSFERQVSQYLDATHTSSEAQIYSVMYRETVSKNLRERHFGPTELMKKTGIRSDRTVRRAIDGLIAKLSIEITNYDMGNPLGPRYRIYKPREIEQRRKAAGIEIDEFSKKLATPVTTPVDTPVATGVKNYRGTPVKIAGVTPVKIAGVFKYRNDHLVENDFLSSSSNVVSRPDDEAFAALVELFKQATTSLTGKLPTPVERDRWRELAELLVAELQIAAARTGQVSNVPAFLTEHLRRRLWKKDKEQLERESMETTASEPAPEQGIDVRKCPDCGSSGWWYPEGLDKGVAKCPHSKLKAAHEGGVE
jgi:hypothetical protein